MTQLKGLTTAVSAAALCTGLLAGATQARELSFAIGHPPVSYLVKGGERASEEFNEATGGDMTLKVYPMSLLSMAETMGGLREGLADVGTVMTPYFPAEFPHTNLIIESSMILETLGEGATEVQGPAFAAAVSEFVFTKCPECVEEFAAQNQVFTGGAGTPQYVLNCTKPVATMEDLQGARLRIGGANWARWSEAIGAAPITMSGNEMLEALNQGVLDCIILSTPDIYNFGMGDSVTHITKGAPGGAYFASMSNMNISSWNELSEEQRTDFLKAMAHGSAWTSQRYQEGAAEVEAAARENGVEIMQADDAVVEATQEFIAEDRASTVAYFQEEYGVERGEEMLDDFTALLEKWVGLIGEADPEQGYGDLYWEEIFSKVDVSQYGVK
ncbi:TRAP-T family transporter, DctP (periplasmic binding) subunit [Pseudooceanicola batsensis HTCC2597]|uniref:TRAP-T family transporter, DctP (Periplasmic binding) subunit n=1 Tax=Pseudooceanicola batsensis (strain ATCC BAA-863 / DSM 15984 / KCTC 12145 / HTCC2597) TaxID=252305 RepID=A3TSQ5_PSEBH|nr:C4-dicarboxylate TRAP transporter substrate-binding protein [Pseudooceanicola batsensis]EAQ04682.1 TRAP-T family transporter, DctP (periplasmic binding) subunit [Pseudooceanicola batsensis HTCC2597]